MNPGLIRLDTVFAPGRPGFLSGRTAEPTVRPSSRQGRAAGQNRSDEVQAAAYFKRLMSGPLGRLDREPTEAELGLEAVRHWQVVRVAGRGGMSTVYEVHSDRYPSGSRAALKLASFAQGARAAKQLMHEYRVLRAIADPAVVGLVDAGLHEDGRPFVVLEYVDGLPLASYAWNLPIRARLSAFLAVCRSVAVVHRAGFVHCDLKPANILMTPAGRAKLIDFGIARASGVTAPTQDDQGHVLTPEFASPEQMMGLPITPASDVYTLGLLLHEILCGRRQRLPWGLSGGSDSAVAMYPTRVVPGEWGTRIVERRAVATSSGATESVLTSEAGAALDSSIEHVLQTALQSDPAQRYSSAVALASVVDGLVAANDDTVLLRTRTYQPRTEQLCVSN